jgi:hypothetical protein
MTEAELEAAAARLNERVATVHERVRCPKCAAPIGARCVRVGRTGLTSASARPLKHSHVERLRADGITLR